MKDFLNTVLSLFKNLEKLEVRRKLSSAEDKAVQFSTDQHGKRKLKANIGGVEATLNFNSPPITVKSQNDE